MTRQTTTLTLPEELERLRAERRRGAATVADLEILEQAVAAPDALEVAWRPPTKNRERITSYKARTSFVCGWVPPFCACIAHFQAPRQVLVVMHSASL